LCLRAPESLIWHWIYGYTPDSASHLLRIGVSKYTPETRQSQTNELNSSTTFYPYRCLQISLRVFLNLFITKSSKTCRDRQDGNLFGLLGHFRGSRRHTRPEETRFPNTGCFYLLYESDTKFV